MSTLQSKLGTALVTSVAATGVFLATPSITEASFGTKNLSFGMEGSDVLVLQERLKEKGFFQHHTATGYFGQITRQAVQDFQRAHNLTPDGIVGPKTFNVLNSQQEQKKTSNTSTENKNSNEQTSTTETSTTNNNTTAKSQQVLEQVKTNHILRVGTRGDEVIKLQLYLKKAGFFDHDTATGYYGAITEQAVRKFQRARGLKVDGIAGPQTLTAINGEISNTNSNPASNNKTEEKKTSGNSSESDIVHTSNPLTALADLKKSNVILRQGDKGIHVTALQTYLKQAGFYTHNITGTYGNDTVTAVRSFQKSANIKVDGIAGPQTFTAIEKTLTKTQTPTNNNQTETQTGNQQQTNTTLLKEGSSGASVTELQNRLRILGHFNQDPTGYFGPVTKQSVIQFQKEWGLIADGLVGKATWSKLEEVSSIHLEDAQTQPSSSFDVMNLIADAASYIGTPYLWGGTSGSGFDCSGFVQYIFKKNNVHLPRTVAEQWKATVSVNQPRVGDIVYFETYKAGPSHNGIYIGNNQFIHSGSSSGVTISRLDSSYYSQRYLGAKRIK
ncbi:peptidoglycan-binding protein [Evansella tamaricis]|uniref:Peptidoglycan-binding protein n=1 Tax=Evansella tamaricis TaxID=2069301 RepID=A0ABS6JKA6_9BACI|nr:peptidoglycan-binding protein [Evansella tamaricis]MBU9712748.1 peptidoglycan-binding protein [Evansella tamaricis]